MTTCNTCDPVLRSRFVALGFEEGTSEYCFLCAPGWAESDLAKALVSDSYAKSYWITATSPWPGVKDIQLLDLQGMLISKVLCVNMQQGIAYSYGDLENRGVACQVGAIVFGDSTWTLAKAEV